MFGFVTQVRAARKVPVMMLMTICVLGQGNGYLHKHLAQQAGALQLQSANNPS
jgi:hypothetical protein